MGQMLTGKEQSVLEPCKKRKKGILYSIRQKKIWLMQDIEPGNAAPMISNEDFFFPKEKLKLFNSLTFDFYWLHSMH